MALHWSASVSTNAAPWRSYGARRAAKACPSFLPRERGAFFVPSAWWRVDAAPTGIATRRLVAPLVARSWRAVTPGQREAPTPTTSPGHAREPRAARLSWTAPQWRPHTSPPPPTREGLRRPGVQRAEPFALMLTGSPQSRNGNPARRFISAALTCRR